VAPHLVYIAKNRLIQLFITPHSTPMVGLAFRKGRPPRPLPRPSPRREKGGTREVGWGVGAAQLPMICL